MKYAVIDIGSNSIRFQVQGESKTLVINTRLGMGLVNTGRMQEENMKRSISVINALVNNAHHMGLIPVAYATAAVREAENQAEFIDRIMHCCNLKVDVLSGDREAEYAFRAVAKPSGGLLDIGGGSFQIVTEEMRGSFPLGCVRGRDIAMAAYAQDCDSNWTERRSLIEQRVKFLLRGTEPVATEWFGVGGTITCLAAFELRLVQFDFNKVNNFTLSRDKIENIIGRLVALGANRREVPILKNRHDIILYGAAILTAVMDYMRIRQITVRTSDGMEGYLDYIINKSMTDN